MRQSAIVILTALCLAANAIEIQGRVLDPEGNPVSGADVWLSRERIVTAAKTSETGEFLFHGAQSGSITLAARKAEFALTGLSGHVFDDLNVDLRMATPDTVRIRVIDHVGNPVEGVRVKRLVIGGAFEIFTEDLVQYGFPSIRSDADGAMAILGIPQGSYVAVTLEHRKFCELFLPYLVPHPRQHPAQLYPGQVLRGHITAADATGVASARALVFREDDGQRLLMYDILADAEGYYNATIPPGTYSLEFHHPGYPTPAPRELRLKDSLNDTIVDATLPPAHTVEGTVVGPKGNPMPGVALSYLVDDFVQDLTYTNRLGKYRLTAAAGEGRVHVIAPPGYMPAEPLDIVVRIEKVPLTEVRPIPLSELPLLSGTVVDTDNAPLEAVLVSALDLKTPLYTLTDAEGKFETPLDVVPEEKEVKMRAEHALRFLRRDFSINIRKKEHDITVALRPFQPDVQPNNPRNAPNDLSSLVGKPAPPLTCQAWINSEELTLDELRGKVVVLLLWAGFDPYAANAAPLSELLLLHKALADSASDVTFVGVHDDSDPPNVVKTYTARLGMTFPVGVDTSPMVTHTRYAATVLPQVVLIDKQGIVRYFDVKGRLLELIKDLRRHP
ncbi:MAG TPA: carboxypeptidase regulatory-like domain-containing protein [Candidatus Hydrogenedentes bacterium]|nr:carboxypeptidase regulatory-like domain-containing protein [Candidatus Hydrogenedentota bacterium]HQE83933.1 carboxypeptidase regulatory-like domain-containing protein [Candidatus Hydrogenedentota bacterium]HQH52650.1 carboxypeptidase regulatory-like domain-containing protein [Candidatus Hydrogenedentota bacterium]